MYDITPQGVNVTSFVIKNSIEYCKHYANELKKLESYYKRIIDLMKKGLVTENKKNYVVEKLNQQYQDLVDDVLLGFSKIIKKFATIKIKKRIDSDYNNYYNLKKCAYNDCNDYNYYYCIVGIFNAQLGKFMGQGANKDIIKQRVNFDTLYQNKLNDLNCHKPSVSFINPPKAIAIKPEFVEKFRRIFDVKVKPVELNNSQFQKIKQAWLFGTLTATNAIENLQNLTLQDQSIIKVQYYIELFETLTIAKKIEQRIKGYDIDDEVKYTDLNLMTQPHDAKYLFLTTVLFILRGKLLPQDLLSRLKELQQQATETNGNSKSLDCQSNSKLDIERLGKINYNRVDSINCLDSLAKLRGKAYHLDFSYTFWGIIDRKSRTEKLINEVQNHISNNSYVAPSCH